MSDDTLKTFDNLSSISNQDIDDALDIIPISHGVGTISQGDKKVKIGQLQQMTVLRCRTDGNVANKQAEYVGGLPLNGNSQACIGRTVLVIFDNKNTAAEPTFSFKNLTGPIILLNQASNVTLGSGCVLANSRNIMTWDGQNWCLHSDIAEITSEYTKYADGTIEYNKQAVEYLDMEIIKMSFLGVNPLGDADNAEYGTYITLPNTNNIPFVSYGFIWAYAFNSGNWKIQLWTSTSTSDFHFYIRKNINLTGWTEWTRIN